MVNRLLRNWIDDRRGNAVMLFCLCLFAIMIAVGSAIDIARIVTIRNKLQDASDAAVLRVMVLGANSTQDQRIAAAEKAFNDNFKDASVYGLKRTLTDNSGGSTLAETYTIGANITSYFGGFVGLDHYTVNVVSKAESQLHKSEIAFVLDSTGSMADSNKMTNLKASVDSVLASMLDKNGNNVSGTQVAIVPFNTQVRLSPDSNLSYVDYGSEGMSEGCKNVSGTVCTAAWDVYDKICNAASDQSGCRASAIGWYGTSSSGGATYTTVTYHVIVGNTVKTYTDVYKTVSTTYAAYSYTDETGTHTVPAGTSSSTSYYSSSSSSSPGTGGYNTSPGAGYTAIPSGSLVYNVSNSGGYGAVAAKQSTSTVNGSSRTYMYPAYNDTKSNWLGCVIDRTKPYDTQADAPNAAVPATLYPARPCATNTLKAVQGLSNNIASARSFVQTLQPGGNTNVTIGVQWGMEVLSPTAPFTGGVAFTDKDTQKYMIIVTDGENTANRDYTSSNPANAQYIDPRTALACTNAKKLGITVFVVKVIEGNSDMLKACATKPDYFYDLSSSAQITTALNSVFESIKKTRLTQ